MTSATDVAVVGAGLSREAAIRAWQAHGIDRWCWRPARSRRLVAGLQRQPEVVLPGWLQRHAGATRQPSGKARPAPVAGPLFVGASIIQGLTRRGFDLSREPISFLSLGPVGWIQRANFIVAGLLVAALAVGVRRALGAGAGGTFGPLFLAGLGVGLVIAGLFHPDAGFGYPPGTPGGPPKLLTYHSQLHGLGFTLSFVFFVLACAAFARAAALERRWPWVAYTGASGAAALILGISPGNSGIAVRDLLAA